MLLDNEYYYSFISKFRFDSKVLECDNDGSRYRKFLVVKYEDKTKIIRLPDMKILNTINNIIKFWDVEEIVSTCIYFDSEFKELKYYHFDDLYFIKYKLDDNIKNCKLVDDTETIYKLLKEKMI